MMRHTVFVPYSPRSYDGICADVRKLYGDDVSIVALVISGEAPPDGVRAVTVARNGSVGPIAVERGGPIAVVANGGVTPQAVAAVILSQRFGCDLVNVQRDGVTTMDTDPAAW